MAGRIGGVPGRVVDLDPVHGRAGLAGLGFWLRSRTLVSSPTAMRSLSRRKRWSTGSTPGSEPARHRLAVSRLGPAIEAACYRSATYTCNCSQADGSEFGWHSRPADIATGYGGIVMQAEIRDGRQHDGVVRWHSARRPGWSRSLACGRGVLAMVWRFRTRSLRSMLVLACVGLALLRIAGLAGGNRRHVGIRFAQAGNPASGAARSRCRGSSRRDVEAFEQLASLSP